MTIGDQKMQNPVFYGAFLAISWVKPRSVVTNYSECMRSNGAYRDAYVTRSQTQSLALTACGSTFQNVFFCCFVYFILLFFFDDQSHARHSR